MDILFPFAEYWWFYGGFLLLVFAMLAVDLGIFHRDAHVVSFRESLTWSVVWVSIALVFNYGFYLYAASQFGGDEGQRLGLEFLTGYIVEKSLAVDNIFIFVMVFAYFGIPQQYQHRVLFYGIIGALLFRAIFIALGSVLMQYAFIVVLFGVFLLLTGVKMLFAPDQKVDPERNPVIRLFKRFMPVTPDFHGQRFLVRLDGKWHATPLMVALVFLELSDVIFAVDSVPAIFAISREPLIVFTSNVFAILGLRSMYFLLAGAVERFALLKYALALILIFVGVKMVWLNDAFGGKFPITWSLGIILGLLTLAILGSFIRERSMPVKTEGAR
ncbi:MAG TPA: TerC family protein [Vicinamibacterales bacterium]|nr:TerC family protein [Vicinamibacterales bacterium]